MKYILTLRKLIEGDNNSTFPRTDDDCDKYLNALADENFDMYLNALAENIKKLESILAVNPDSDENLIVIETRESMTKVQLIDKTKPCFDEKIMNNLRFVSLELE